MLPNQVGNGKHGDDTVKLNLWSKNQALPSTNIDYNIG
jgi:hypothetical protein